MEHTGDRPRARALYEGIAREHPNYVDAYLRLACLERDEGQLQKAMKWIEVALAVQPDNHDALTLRGNLHLRRKDFQKVR